LTCSRDDSDAHTLPTCTPALVINGTAIRFTNDDKLVNLTDLWKAGGADEMRRPSRWLKQDQAKDFVSNLRRLNNVAQNDIIHTTYGRFGGTFAHWQIALAYAKYLSPEFHILCNNIIRRFVEEEQNPDNQHPTSPSHVNKNGYNLVKIFVDRTEEASIEVSDVLTCDQAIGRIFPIGPLRFLTKLGKAELHSD